MPMAGTASAAASACANEKRAGEARALGVGHRPEIRGLAACLRQQVAGERHEAPDVVARGELRHHPAVGLVHVDLRVHCMAEEAPGAGVVERHAGLVAGGLDTQDQHAREPLTYSRGGALRPERGAG
jgi:hypothetical protein